MSSSAAGSPANFSDLQVENIKWDEDTPRTNKAEEGLSLRTSACSGDGVAAGRRPCACVFVCTSSVYPGVATPATTEWAGSVGWRGAPWVPLQGRALSGPAKVSLLPGWGLGAGAGRTTLQHDQQARRAVARKTFGTCEQSTRSHVLAARVNFSIDSKAEWEKKKIPLGTRWRSKRGRVWLCVCVFGGRVGWSERRREDQERGEQE